MKIDRVPIVVMSSREFNQNTSKAKRAARHGPVFITDRGEPTHVLITKDAFDRMDDEKPAVEPKRVSLREALVDPIYGDRVALEIEPRTIEPPEEFDW